MLGCWAEAPAVDRSSPLVPGTSGATEEEPGLPERSRSYPIGAGASRDAERSPAEGAELEAEPKRVERNQIRRRRAGAV